jgi:hypothetical protein
MVTEPEGWMIPAKLYERENVWCSADWDWRDGYLAVAVGRLFRIRDFLPRAIVRGPYFHEATIKGQAPDGFLATHLTRVARELPDAVTQLDAQWPETPSLERERWNRSEKGAAGYARFLAALGDEITLANWPDT